MTSLEPGPSRRPAVRLGLIGDNIRDSRSPDLHRLAGELCGLDVEYELLIPREIGRSFDEIFDNCRAEGLGGVNITYPYKEQVIGRLSSRNPDVARVGSSNTVVFTPQGPVGYNTDYLGFIAAYRAHFGDLPAGRVAIVGAGGVGRAIAFAVTALGSSELRLIDTDGERATKLAAALAEVSPAPAVRVETDIGAMLGGADGVVNCTPLGMSGRPGSAIPANLLGGQSWAFDAVYTPIETEFLRAARAAGLDTLSGYELFFQQGIKAFELFTGRVPPLDALRQRLAGPAQHREAS
ncbi:MAG TPA: shikimate dehydrogenase [Devosiaceae bacterium]|jgi:shikimate dehydrogenase|nr:shikimate dehydrogenase [Devosiaceae bacterium]